MRKSDRINHLTIAKDIEQTSSSDGKCNIEGFPISCPRNVNQQRITKPTVFARSIHFCRFHPAPPLAGCLSSSRESTTFSTPSVACLRRFAWVRSKYAVCSQLRELIWKAMCVLNQHDSKVLVLDRFVNLSIVALSSGSSDVCSTDRFVSAALQQPSLGKVETCGRTLS